MGGGERRAVDGRDVEEEEIARPGLVEGIRETGVGCEVGGEDVAGVGLVVGVADVVDAEEEGKKGVVALSIEGVLYAVGVER